MQAVSHRGPSQIFGSSHVQTEVLAMSARHFLLGKNNWLSIEPDPEWSAAYEHGYRRFRRLYPALRPLEDE